jgi:tripartite-type tricarboxylate transporter receptor subunit TctC
MVIPYAAGGGADIAGRFIGAKLTDELRQQFIADNRVGAGSTVGTDIVAKAPADGYTLLVTNSGLAYNATLYSKLPYDTLKDFVGVSLIGTTPNVLVVHPSVPVKSVKELLDLMKAKPGQLNFGSGGIGSSAHLAVELFENMAGVKATHIPYKGAGPALIDTVGGQVKMMIATMPAAIGHIKSSRLRALAVSGAKRSPTLPDLPTIAEGGVAGYDYTTWYGMLVSAATPIPIITRLNLATTKVLGSADLREKLAQQGLDAESSTPEQFTTIVRNDVARWAKIIKAMGITAENP